jgi:transposase
LLLHFSVCLERGAATMSHPTTRLGRHRRYSPERAWEPLSDTEWAVLSPFVFRTADVAGRPVRDPRGRLDAIFWLAAHTLPGRAPPPWAALPERFGKPDTASRQFRRWAKQGLWTKLLQALAEAHYPGIAVLRRLESWICRAFRRAWRLLGVQGMALARRLGFLSALRGPSWLLPNPDLSEYVFRRVDEELSRGLRAVPPGFLRAACRLLTAAGGRRSIPRCLAPP